jgi:hypothetical protein
MSNETKIAIWSARQKTLATRGPQNNHIIAKLARKIRSAQTKE